MRHPAKADDALEIQRTAALAQQSLADAPQNSVAVNISPVVRPAALVHVYQHAAPNDATDDQVFGAQCECQCLAPHAVVVVDELALIVRYRLRNLSRALQNLHMNEPNPGRSTAPVPAPTTSREVLAANLRTAMRAEAASLRDAVCEYVDAARQRGEPVERVIIDLKQEMRAAGVVDRYVKPNERALAESVIRWCIERYYGTVPRAD